MAKILVVDDSAVDRALVTSILSEDSRLSVQSAKDGREALTCLQRERIDAVVTDLQMPELDGLQLVTAIRLDFPHVPVVLMTSKGSEIVAMEALKQGAASYVPKQKLAQWLPDTIQDVLSLSHAERAYQALISCFHTAQFGVTLENDHALFDPLVDYIQQIVVGMRICDAAGGFQFGVALREALAHAAFRGNLELTAEQIIQESERLVQGQKSLIDERRAAPPYNERRVHVEVKITGKEARVTVRHQGSSWDAKQVPSADPRALVDSGAQRGLVLMQALMDEVQFHHDGNQVTLIKRKPAPRN
jgi:CheY-like chemotaxis protein